VHSPEVIANAFLRQAAETHSRILQNLGRRNEISLGPRNPKLLHPEVERRPFDPQSRSGAVWTGHHPPGSLQNLAYVLSLHILQRHCFRGFCFSSTIQARKRGRQNTLGADD